MVRTIFSVLCLSALAACNSAGKKQAPPKPNILVIYADDVGIGDISSYGSELIKTPHIDAICLPRIPCV